jgi:hypothetical protein
LPSNEGDFWCWLIPISAFGPWAFLPAHSEHDCHPPIWSILEKLCAFEGTPVLEAGAGVGVGAGAGVGAGFPLLVVDPPDDEDPDEPGVVPVPTEGSVVPVPVDGPEVPVGKGFVLELLKGLADPDPHPAMDTAARHAAAI